MYFERNLSIIGLGLAIVLLFAGVSYAEQSLPVQMAHKKDFYGCDSKIDDVFDNFSSNLRVSTKWFDETKNEQLTILGTSGTTGDSFYVEGDFTKKNGKCFAMETFVLSFQENCMAVKQNWKNAKYVDEQADFVWTDNNGIDVLFKTIPGGCIIIGSRGSIQ